MLFNSFEFLLVFLPVALAGFFYATKYSFPAKRLIWLVLASLFFYAFSNPLNLPILIACIAFNFGIGLLLSNASRRRKLILALGIGVNILALALFKYLAFGVETLNALTSLGLTVPDVVLPLAISFIVFQQIAFLVDVYQGKTAEKNFLRFCAFATFFPQLIAGPISHHREIAPQFEADTFRLTSHNVMIGLTLLLAGLCKKVLIADNIAPYVNGIFALADAGRSVHFLEAWAAAIGYTFQLYFDFSGYTDMATGVARMFGIVLPLNFLSPYKSASIIDFWRRWHITLSRFLRDYIYIPLGGSRKGPLRRYLNLFITMLIGGLWHGAGWTFIMWGALHGFYLVINHGWRALLKTIPRLQVIHSRFGKAPSYLFTFGAVSISWVFFRASTFDGALRILQGMTGENGLQLPKAIASFLPFSPETWTSAGIGFSFEKVALLPLSQLLSSVGIILFAAVVCFWAPNIYQVLAAHKPVLESDSLPATRFAFRPSYPLSIGFGFLSFAIIILLALAERSEFLYFQF
jgi:alginate O-acetyltransferase complex protein AlgI